MPVLTLYSGKQKLKTFRLNPEAPLTIGRLASNAVVLDDPAVSNLHAEIENDGDQYFITDYQSRNGTFVNKELVISRQLNHGDRIAINPFILVFGLLKEEQKKVDAPELSQATMHIDTSDHRSRLARSLSEMADSDAKKDRIGCLEFLNASRAPFVLSESITRIGKSAECDIVVKGLMVGSKAVEIAKIDAKHYVLRFLGGARKPRVNYQPVSAEVVLNEFDIIELGATTMQFSYSKYRHGSFSQRTRDIEGP